MAKRRQKKEDKSEENKGSLNWTQIIVAIIGLIGVIAAALISKLPTNSQLSEETSTSTIIAPTNTVIIPTATVFTDTPIPPTATQTKTALPQPLTYIDDFSKKTSSFLPLTPYEDDYWKGSFSVSNGVYQIIINDKKGVIAGIQTNNIPDSSNLEIEVGFKLIDGISYIDYGIVFRYGSLGFYYFGINPENKNYVLKRWEFDGNAGKWIQVSSGTSQAISEGTNNIKVSALGNKISAYINNVPIVADVSDDAFSSGKIKLAVSIYDEGKITLEITSFRVSIFP